MTSDERIAALEARLDDMAGRLREVEDRLEITTLIHRYGPAVDSGSADATVALFTATGVYDVDTGLLSGPREIAAMVDGDDHRGLVDRGCSHVMSAPQIRVAGDAASAVSYSQLLVHRSDGRGVAVVRSTANSWRFERTPDGWRVARRTARVIDGGDEARRILSEGPPPP
ncbi:nuclear transport factor 2 family protein [Gordonia shandongensis]|uniref:nuclear transport factor 2 family protein n=1 Tax=Gordonia shandongensis TaxID=376351 RepID=UPI0004120051|nr:nuclear transport factor 2 family protein [Gordonia shandongensis]